MNTSKYYLILPILFGTAFLALLVVGIDQGFAQKKKKKNTSPDEIILNPDGKGNAVAFEFHRGIKHNHPMFALWIEDDEGNYLQTLFVNQSVAKGYFRHVNNIGGKWEAGELQRPASLPVWAHKRGQLNEKGNYMPTPKNPVPDAYTRATPSQSFIVRTNTDKSLPDRFTVCFEINQAWDWNSFWTNNKYPEDEEYKTSSQPSVIYKSDIDMNNLKESYTLEPVGTGHYSGKDGNLHPQLETLTTALQIAEKVIFKLGK